MQEKKRKRTILKCAGIIGILFGLVILLFTLTLVRIVTTSDMSSLISVYGPDSGCSYEDLYDLAKHIGGQRNYLAMLFFSMLSIVSILFGAILLTWARDLRLLQKDVGHNELHEDSSAL